MCTLHRVVATGDVRVGGENERLVALVEDVERDPCRLNLCTLLI